MKKYFWISIVLSVLLTVGCGKEAPPMDRELVINILTDVHIAEALISGRHQSVMKDSLENRYLSQVLEKWNISQSEFEIALSHMHGDPDYMREIYKSIQDKLEKYSKELDLEGSENEEMMLE